MSEHTVEAVAKVQTQQNMTRIKLKQSLNPMDDSFSPSGRPSPKLNGGEEARQGARREKAERKSRRSAKENL